MNLSFAAEITLCLPFLRRSEQVSSYRLILFATVLEETLKVLEIVWID
jgi:hypothetical protein